MASRTPRNATVLACRAALLASVLLVPSERMGAAPLLLDPNLQVGTAASGLSQPTGIAFIGANEMLVSEKATGQVKRFVNGVSQGAVLDLAVNSGSERGLLGMALSPNFASDRFVYLYWTESSTGADTNVLANTSLLGHRVDRFSWNGSTLTLDQNITRLRARQTDDQAERGNNNGGKLGFGPDGLLYIEIGDVGRRGNLQNIATGLLPGGVDDAFGGPKPDNAHLTGAVLRLNPDGSTPITNPFFNVNDADAQVSANIKKIFAYGIRNSFGMAFDPLTGQLWMSENGDDSFDELNRVTAGMNSGWAQIMGPLSRIGEFKTIETTAPNIGLQQSRWPPSNIANTGADALNAMFMLPGAAYSDPEFSWKYNVSPAAIGFQSGNGLGAQYNGDLFVGAATLNLDAGYLLRFNLNAARDGIDTSGALGLADLVADNNAKYDPTESESLRFGTGFGVVTDIRTGLNGNLFVTSLTDGVVYEISSLVAVPEPASLALIALGLLLLQANRRKSDQSQRAVHALSKCAPRTGPR